jgi:hypothetical protein
MENKNTYLRLFVMVSALSLSGLLLAAPRGLPVAGRSSTGSAPAAPAAAKKVEVDVQDAVNLLSSAKNATSVGDALTHIASAATRIKGYASTANISDSSKEKIRQLIADNATANLNMVIGARGGAGLAAAVKTDLNAILTTISGWGTNVNTYASTWGIK